MGLGNGHRKFGTSCRRIVARRRLLTRLNPRRRSFKVVCPYCQAVATLKDSSVVYDKPYGKIWLCSNWPECDSMVGAHKNGEPKGTMANGELRKWRINAHREFDRHWKGGNAGTSRRKKRTNAYKKLAGALALPSEKAHIAMLNVKQCKRVIEAFEAQPPDPERRKQKPSNRKKDKRRKRE